MTQVVQGVEARSQSCHEFRDNIVVPTLLSQILINLAQNPGEEEGIRLLDNQLLDAALVMRVIVPHLLMKSFQTAKSNSAYYRIVIRICQSKES